MKMMTAEHKAVIAQEEGGFILTTATTDTDTTAVISNTTTQNQHAVHFTLSASGGGGSGTRLESLNGDGGDKAQESFNDVEGGRGSGRDDNEGSGGVVQPWSSCVDGDIGGDGDGDSRWKGSQRTVQRRRRKHLFGSAFAAVIVLCLLGIVVVGGALLGKLIQISLSTTRSNVASGLGSSSDNGDGFIVLDPFSDANDDNKDSGEEDSGKEDPVDEDASTTNVDGVGGNSVSDNDAAEETVGDATTGEPTEVIDDHDGVEPPVDRTPVDNVESDAVVVVANEDESTEELIGDETEGFVGDGNGGSVADETEETAADLDGNNDADTETAEVSTIEEDTAEEDTAEAGTVDGGGNDNNEAGTLPTSPPTLETGNSNVDGEDEDENQQVENHNDSPLSCVDLHIAIFTDGNTGGDGTGGGDEDVTLWELILLNDSNVDDENDAEGETIIDSGGPLGPNETIDVRRCVPSGRYAFRVSDSGGDGLGIEHTGSDNDPESLNDGAAGYIITANGIEIGASFSLRYDEELVAFDLSYFDVDGNGNYDGDEYDGDGEEVCADDFVLAMMTDDEPEETTWELLSVDNGDNDYNENGRVVLRGGPYAKPGGRYTTRACLPNGDYALVVRDAGGDGICCGHGRGFVVLYSEGWYVRMGEEDNDDDAEHDDGAFGSEIWTTFSLGNVPSDLDGPVR